MGLGQVWESLSKSRSSTARQATTCTTSPAHQCATWSSAALARPSRTRTVLARPSGGLLRKLRAARRGILRGALGRLSPALGILSPLAHSRSGTLNSLPGSPLAGSPLGNNARRVPPGWPEGWRVPEPSGGAVWGVDRGGDRSMNNVIQHMFCSLTCVFAWTPALTGKTCKLLLNTAI